MKKFAVLLLILFTVVDYSAQTKLTFDEAVSIALQRNSNVIKAKNNLEGNESNLKSAWGDLLPSFGGSAGWSWSKTKDKGSTQVDFFGNEQVIPASETDNRSYSLSAGGNITLFNGLANYANISKRKGELVSAEYSLMKLKQDVVYRTTELFYTVINAEELVKVRKDNVAYNEKLLETIQERNRLGSVAIADVYAQEVQLGNAKVQMINQQNVFENAKSEILNYLALDVLEEYKIVDPFSGDEKINTQMYLNQFGDIQSMVNDALANRYDYKSQNLTVENRENDKTIAWGGVMPRLSGNYGFSTGAVRPDNLLDRKTYSAGLTLSIPVFSNFNVENQIQFAEIGIKNSKEDLAALTRQIKIEVKQGYLDLLASVEAYEVSISSVQSALENRRINNERYSLGSGTILDVLQADRDYQGALSNKIDAEYNVHKLRDRLLNAVGQLEFNKYE